MSGYRVSVKIDGLDHFASDLDNSPQMVIDELSTGIWDSAQLMERMAEEAAPHATGALQSSIHAEPPKVNQKTITGQVGLIWTTQNIRNMEPGFTPLTTTAATPGTVNI